VVFILYVWFGVLLIALVLEAVTAGLFSIWFVPPALVAMVLAYFDVPLPLQLVVFFGLSILLIAFSKTIWKKYLSVKPIEPTNTDALIGQTGIVTERIDNIAGVGAVKLEGKVWSARSKDGSVYEPDDLVRILDIQGVKLICEKISNN